MNSKKDRSEMKILVEKNKIITREKLFEDKANFHKHQAKLSFEEKIRILVKLQKIANRIRKGNKIIWEI